ncbi:MAG: glycerol-3-phosphate 1-O-acyltransferase PlsY [Elusimicrobia bacterium]|nr:glycerol-3-phosphate 1-O-acyltransferase PlsY [Elusimicrobiota bacterium]MBD3411991.1 glycerol-3-phosphate 1-O-acyltransferase PlsY [Elusimicrobiota bacterium]
MAIVFSLTLAYLIGSIPFGYMYSRMAKGIDIRQFGSGNIGATNVYRMVGPWSALATLSSDMIKGLIPVLFAKVIMPDNHLMHIATGFAAIAGHTWTLFLNFKGGKGVATSAGVFVALLPIPTFISFIVFCIVLVTSRYVALSSISAAAALPLATLVFRYSWSLFIFTAIIAALIVVRHWSNIERLREGKEDKFSFKKLSTPDTATKQETTP